MTWTNEEEKYLKNNFLIFKKEDIIKKLNRSWDTILWKVRQLKINNKNFVHNRKFTLDFDFFSNPNIKNSYWAGFIAADGSISKCGKILDISLKSTDIDILEALKKDINYGGDIKTRINNKSNQVRLTIKNRKIIQDLEENFNIINNKSLIYNPNNSKMNLMNSLAFIRGYCDGDGCIKYNNRGRIIIDFNGTYETVEWIKNTLYQINKNKVGKCNISNIKSIYRWSLNGKNAIYFLNIFKRLDTFNLKRKWDKKELNNITKISDYKNGWIMGMFLPSVLINDKFELGIKRYNRGVVEMEHYHKLSKEFTIVISGIIKMNGVEYKKDDIIEIDIFEKNIFECVEDCTLIVIKTPSSPNDKYYI